MIDDLVAEKEKEIFGVGGDEVGDVVPDDIHILEDISEESFEFTGSFADAGAVYFEKERQFNRRKLILWFGIMDQSELDKISALVRNDAGNVIEFIAKGVGAKKTEEELVPTVKEMINSFLDSLLNDQQSN